MSKGSKRTTENVVNICWANGCVHGGCYTPLFITIHPFALMLGTRLLLLLLSLLHGQEPSTWMDRNLTSFEMRKKKTKTTAQESKTENERKKIMVTKAAAIFRLALNKNEKLFFFLMNQINRHKFIISFFGCTRFVFSARFFAVCFVLFMKMNHFCPFRKLHQRTE